MTWWLSVFFLIQGVWVPGSEVRPVGWSPRAYLTEQECRARKEFAEEQVRNFPLDRPTEWRCTASDSPLKVRKNLREIGA